MNDRKSKRPRRSVVQSVPAPTASLDAVPVSARVSWQIMAMWVCLIVVVVSLVYARTVTFEFTSWDDQDNVTGNLLLERGWSSLKQIWSEPYRNLYVPLVYTSYLVDMSIGGGAPFVFHLHNVICMVLAAVGVFVFLRLVSARLGLWFSPAACALGALIFAIHPLQAEPVSWVTGRKDVLSGVFGVWSLVLHQMAMRRAEASPRVGLQRFAAMHVLVPMLAACCFLALALFAKPGAVVIPLIIIASELSMPSDKSHTGQTFMRLVTVLPLLAIAAVFAIITSSAQPLPPGLAAMQPLTKRPLTMLATYAWYAKSIVWPVGLSPVYGLLAWQLPGHLLMYVGILLFSVAAVLTWRLGRGPVAMAMGIFAAGLLPLSGITPYLYQIYSAFADRYAYFALLAPALLVAFALHRAMQGRSPTVVLAVAGALIAVLAGITVYQTGFWRNSETLWARALTTAPELAEANNNYGYAIAIQKRAVEARPYFEKAVSLKPGYADAWINLGLSQSQMGEPDKAIVSYMNAMKNKPNASAAYSNLMAEYINLNRFNEAVSTGQNAIQNNAVSTDVLLNLAIAHLRLGQPAQSQKVLRRILEIRPNYAPAQNLLNQIEGALRRP